MPPLKVLLLSVLLSAAVAASTAVPAPSGEAAQTAHAAGSCGSLGPGTGLRDGKGWIVSMLPGKHEFRVRGGGTAYLTVARMTSLDFDVGRPYYIVLEGLRPDSVLEWKVPGKSWEPVAKTFLYPA